MSTLMNQTRSRVPRFAEAAVERARLTVVPGRVQRAPRVPFITLVSLLLVTGVVGLLLFNTHMQQASFTATELEARAAALDAKEEKLRMDLASLRDPQRVAQQAQRLGMVPPDSPAFIRLADGEVLGNPEVAQPGNGVRIVPLPTPKPKDLRPSPVVLDLPEPKARTRSGDSSRTRPRTGDAGRGRAGGDGRVHGDDRGALVDEASTAGRRATGERRERRARRGRAAGRASAGEAVEGGTTRRRSSERVQGRGR